MKFSTTFLLIILTIHSNITLSMIPNELNNFQSFESISDGPVPFSIFYNNEPWKYIEMDLTLLAHELKENSDEKAQIIVYSGKRALKNETKCFIETIKKFLVKKKKINHRRLFFFDGGYRKRGLTEIYLRPKGANLLKPSPTLLKKDVILLEESACSPKKHPKVKKSEFS